MRALLIHNPTAGDGDREGDDLRAALSRHGDDIAYLSSKSDDLKREIRTSDVELFIVAGGDGTVAKVVRAIAGRSEVPLLILPIGTANNIAGSLGIERAQLDLNVVRDVWKSCPFDAALSDDDVIVESAGCGVLAAFMGNGSHGEREGVKKEAKSMAELVASATLFDYHMTLDGDESRGEALLIEVMLIPQVGPNLVLAPEADPGDGLLDVVVIREEHREELLRYLASGGRREPPSFVTRRVESATVAGPAPWHLDDKSIEPRTHTIDVHRGAWHALVPR